MIGVKLLRLRPEAMLPNKGTPGSAYYDLYSAEEGILRARGLAVITTGWRIEVPMSSFLDIRPRSGLACEGITVNNAPGTVDADYRGELKVILVNHSPYQYHISIGDRIAQCALMPIFPTSFEEVEELSRTSRGEGGYGSTGK